MAPFFNNEADNIKYNNTMTALRNFSSEKALYRGFWRYHFTTALTMLITGGGILF
jgi:hypothetical protein